MAEPMTEVWCNVAGEKDVFHVLNFVVVRLHAPKFATNASDAVWMVLGLRLRKPKQRK